ncbi:phenylacetic acid degradation protein PaaN [Herbaspirillum chlorophenolicum]|uniref:phenylacetic acid degradation protein PaaN n=1 Tax=Herbaspirillum chlorophenolicum TaxID=211589 RepID=UPI00067E4B99|nr:phenylacetic acid degradation protein PaaN [Herbaspirillum chlorophenolicum]
MSIAFFERHRATLEQAVQALQSRGYWSQFSESPSPRVYGETAADTGKAAYEARLNRPFELAQAASAGLAGSEASPYGFNLGITYPKPVIGQLLPAVSAAAASWRRAGPKAWAGVSLEIVARLNARSFEIAHAVMHTTGQAFMMAFQAGGPHAQDRALEAIGCAWQQMSLVPATADWEKPQGKHAPLQMRKSYRIVPRGIGLVIGCCTFPTWNSYPGLFANLATGNAVIVKPHPGAILPLAITVEVAREVLAEAGFDPDIVTLFAHDRDDAVARELALRPEIALIDFTGSSANGNWLERNALQAKVYTEKSGVNQIVIDSTDDLQGMARNIAFSLCLYSGQMCTTPQNIYIPKDGIRTPEGHASFEAVTAAITDAIARLTGDAAKAVEVLGAIQNDGVRQKIEAARTRGKVLLDSIALQHPQFAEACIRTPLVVQVEANSAITEEFFGPVSFVIPVDDTTMAVTLAERTAQRHGALTLSGYSTDPQVKDALADAAANAGVALSLNLTGGVFVNQSAAFSDYHGTGANPAANAALADAAFVADRFRVVQTREPVSAPAAN